MVLSTNAPTLTARDCETSDQRAIDKPHVDAMMRVQHALLVCLQPWRFAHAMPFVERLLLRASLLGQATCSHAQHLVGTTILQHRHEEFSTYEARTSLDSKSRFVTDAQNRTARQRRCLTL
jgi:hypothetical protein